MLNPVKSNFGSPDFSYQNFGSDSWSYQIYKGAATASQGGRVSTYNLHFYGPNAEEVAGTGYIIGGAGQKNTYFGFSGAR